MLHIKIANLLNSEERKTPAPTPYKNDKISDQMFSDFESNQSINDDNISSGQKSKGDQASIYRRSKADRQKVRNTRKQEKERNIAEDTRTTHQSSYGSTSINLFNERIQSQPKDFAKTITNSANKQSRVKEDKGFSAAVDMKNQSIKSKSDSLGCKQSLFIL